jgi:hypothetical protein
MIWSADAQIKTSSGAPQSNDGPVLACSGTRLYMAYRGQGGSNLWWAWCDNKTGNFTDWQGNVQIKQAGAFAVSTICRPALVFYDGFPVLLYLTGDIYLSCLVFDGNEWNEGPAVTFLDYGKSVKYESITATVAGGRIYMAVMTNDGAVFPYSYTGPLVPAAGASRSTWQSGADVNGMQGALNMAPGIGRVYVTLESVQASVAYYAYTDPSQSAVAFFPAAFGQIEPAQGAPLITAGGTLVLFNGQLLMVYVGKGGQTMYWAPFQSFSNNNMLLGASNAISGTGFTAKTGSPLSSVVFQNMLCIAHKANSSSNLYLIYGR